MTFWWHHSREDGGGPQEQGIHILFYFGCARPTVDLERVLGPSPFWQVAVGTVRVTWRKSWGVGFLRELGTLNRPLTTDIYEVFKLCLHFLTVLVWLVMSRVMHVRVQLQAQ